MENYEAFFNFMQENAKDPAIVAENIELVRPLFEMAEKMEFKFGEAVDLDKEKAKKVISTAIGKPVSKIILVSNSKAQFEPITMKAYNNILESDLGERLGDSLRSSLGLRLWGNLWNNLFDNLGSRLGIKVAYLTENGLQDTSKLNLWYSLLCLFAAVLLEARHMIERLKPLLVFLSKGYIPIGFKPDEPETYLVMVA